MDPSSLSCLKTSRIVSLLTDGQARSISEMEKGPIMFSIVIEICWALLPLPVVKVPTRPSNSL